MRTLERHGRQRSRRYVRSSEGGGAGGGVQVGPRLVQEGVEGEALFLGALQEEVRRGELRLGRL